MRQQGVVQSAMVLMMRDDGKIYVDWTQEHR